MFEPFGHLCKTPCRVSHVSLLGFVVLDSLTVTAGNSCNSSWEQVQMTRPPWGKDGKIIMQPADDTPKKTIHPGYLHDIFHIATNTNVKSYCRQKSLSRSQPPNPAMTRAAKPVSGCCDWLFSEKNTKQTKHLAILVASQCKYLDLVTNQKTRQVFRETSWRLVVRGLVKFEFQQKRFETTGRARNNTNHSLVVGDWGDLGDVFCFNLQAVDWSLSHICLSD